MAIFFHATYTSQNKAASKLTRRSPVNQLFGLHDSNQIQPARQLWQIKVCFFLLTCGFLGNLKHIQKPIIIYFS